MAGYVFKSCILDGREYFVFGRNGETLTKRDYPFPWILSMMLALDITEIESVTHQIDFFLA